MQQSDQRSGKRLRIINRLLTSIILITVLFTVANCNGNYRGVQIEGKVYDKTTKQPLAGVNIAATFWVYQTDRTAWESKAVEVEAVTQSDGSFSFEIQEAEAYDLTIKHGYYADFSTSKTLKRSYNEEAIYLEK